MPWYAPWSDVIKKKVCRFVLQRYLGQFLEEKLSLDQLNVDFYNGTGTVYDVTLYCQALNELCEGQGWGIEVTGGHIGSVKVSIPYEALLTKDSFIEVTNLTVTLRPKARENDGTSMLESMWSSMSSSMQLAQECLEREANDAASIQSNAIEGLEKFAQIIDNVLNRIKAKLIDTELRLEYMQPDSDCGVCVIIRVKNIDYQNEAGSDPPDKENTDDNNKRQPRTFSLQTYATHHIVFEGITFYTEEFRIHDPTSPTENRSANVTGSEQFISNIANEQEDEDGNDDENRAEQQAEYYEEDDDDEPCECIRSGEVKIGHLSSRQEIRLRMKLADHLQGPNVELEMSFGALTLFMTPRQLHLLILLSDILINGSEVAPAKVSPSHSNNQRMQNTEGDFDFKHDYSSMSGGIGLNQGWSISNDTASHFKSLHSEFLEREMDRESIISSNSSMTSSVTSIATRTTASRRRGIDPDEMGDISHFNLRIACIGIVLLHEDILVECSQFCGKESPLSLGSVQNLQSKSDRFFRSASAISGNDIFKAGKILDSGCESNHLRLLAAPIILEGEEQRNIQGNVLHFSLSIARADFREVLADVSVPLIEFVREKNVNALPKRPEILINFKQVLHALKRSRGKRFAAPKNEITITLAPFLTEFDISILDRISTVLYKCPFVSSLVDSHLVNPPSPMHVREPKTDIKIDCPIVDVRLRFPIPDLRPIHDPQRVPWWQRNIRPDYILLNFQQMRARIGLNMPQVYDVCANEVNLFYYENDIKLENVNIGKAVMCESATNRYGAQSVDYPRVVVEIPSEQMLQKCQEIGKGNKYATSSAGEDTDSEPTSGESIGVSTAKQKEDTPFSSKRVCRESETTHAKQNADDPEMLIIPGDNAEMKSFCDNAIKLSKIQIKLTLPVVSLQIKSKHLYEVLYNRINSDFLLWQPSAPVATTAAQINLSTYSSKTIFNQPESSLLNAGMMDSIYVPFTMCESRIQFESSSSATNSESESDSDGIFYSVYDKSVKAKKHPVIEPYIDKSNSIAFQLDIGQGMVTMFAPVRDSQNHVIPGQLGEFVTKVNNLSVFSVNGFHGNTNLGFLCIQGKGAELYHCGLVPTPSANPPLRLINSVLPSHMFSTLYPTPKNLTLNDAKGYPNRDMIALAIQIKLVPEQSIKRIRVSAGIQLATLKHNSSLPQHAWLTQLLDMFDVVDYPVLGYTPHGVITEMHLHLWDCAIDYRPLYFPYRAVITVGNFMITSNITTASTGCTLRFVAEDATLSLAPQTPPGGDQKSREDNKITALPSSELICVIELGLFEISLRLNEKVTASFPKFDLRTAINGFQIRTCADSGQALAQLIGYLAAEGDLLIQDDKENEEETCLPSENEVELLPVKPTPPTVGPEVTPKQQQRVNSLMADAMEETLNNMSPDEKLREDSLIADGEGVEVFFFPDEANQVRFHGQKKSDISNKRRFVSDEDSISIDEASSIPSSYQDDDDAFIKQRVYADTSEDTLSVNTEMRELLNFECSVMGMQGDVQDDDDEVLDAQVTMDLGDITKIEINPQPKVEKNIPRKISSDTDDDFCFIGDEEKPQCGHQEVPVSEDPIRIIDNHFSVEHGKPDLLKAPKDFPMAVMRYTLCEMSLTWHLYGGKDFSTSEERKKSKSKRSEQHFVHLPMSEAYKSGVSYSKGSPTITFGQKSSPKLCWKVKGGDERKHDVLMEIQINKVRFSHETYPSNTEQASRQVLLITEIEIRDRLVVSHINKFLYHPVTGPKTKKGNQHMVVMKALHLRPDPSLPAQECCLRISLLPLRLNIDQDSLLFLVNFFNELGGGSNLATEKTVQPSSGSPRSQSIQKSVAPVMMVELPDAAAQELQARKMVSENLMLLMEEEEKNKESSETSSDIGDNAPIYFRNIIFSPDVPINIDYVGKRVELSHGPLAGLLMGLGQLQCSQIVLKKIQYRHGILGVDRLLNFLLQEWLQDIKKKQLPKILGGVGPMYSLVQLFQGIWDLFWLPIEQYQKDGRIVRGLQRGAQSFTARTALAALEITTRIIHLLQITAETAYDMVSPGPSVRRGRGNRKGKRKRLHPPQDIREGMTNAYQIVKEGIGDTAMNLVELTALEHDQKGYTGAVGAVIRQIPPIVVQPLVLAAQATTNVLGGVKNQLIPDAAKDAKEKYKEDEE